MIPEDYRDRIINDGLLFITTISSAYGAEDGIKLWEQIAQVIDPDIKGEIFMAMLCGTAVNRITIKGFTVDQADQINRIDFIKVIRTLSGIGLKEAKELMDKVWAGSEILLQVMPDMRNSATRLFRDIGITWI